MRTHTRYYIRLILLVICILYADSNIYAAAETPSNYDQYVLELVNRARANPDAEAARYGIDLNEGLTPGTITSDAKQPLAFNPYLIDAARGHTETMFALNEFAHQCTGEDDVQTRMINAGYVFTPGWGYGENIAAKHTWPGPLDVTEFSYAMHTNLFVDAGIAGRGHRLNICNGSMKEIGVGVLTGLYTIGATEYDTSMVTEDFAYSANNSDPFLTGVLYKDYDNDNFYTPGEGISNIVITASNTTTHATYVTTNWISGGYTLALPAGDYEVIFDGGAFLSPAIQTVTIQSGVNEKLDIVVPEPSVIFIIGIACIAAIIRRK